ncbi:MAG: elongation factor G [Propylenella sp.]
MSDNGRKTGPRCIAIVGPFASGKTSLLEAILARTGALDKPGSVTGGSAVGDSSPEARAHSMSVELNVAETTFMDDKYTFLDCPGSVEFTYESEPLVGGIDAAIVVAEPDEKKVSALQVVLRHLEERGIPRFLFLNKIDKTAVSVRDALAMLQPASETPLVLRQIPIFKNEIATGFIDLALDRAFVYREHAPSEVIEIESGDVAQRDEARFSMLERLADHDDALMEQLLEDIQPPRDKIFGDLAAELRAGQIVPVLIGSALNGNGIMRLLKALRHESPSIDDTRKRLGVDDSGKTILQVMKTIHTSHSGKLSLARVLAGKVDDGMELSVPRGEAAKVSGIYGLLGQKSSKRGAASAGETVGLGKLDTAKTGDTLGGKGAAAKAIAVPPPPQAVLRKVVTPVERKDEVKLSSALSRMVEEDPSLSVDHRQDTGEMVLGGQGEMHLRVAVERLTSRFGLKLETKRALVPYRETIKASVTKRGRHKKQSGGHGQFGDVVLEVKPLPRGTGFSFSDTITGGVVPKNYIPAVEAGVREAVRNGPLGGFPVVDIGVTLTDGSYHDVDSSDQAFKMAGILGMREALPDARPVLLEPILRVKISVPNDGTARVNAIVSGRRGQLMGFDARPGWKGWDQVEALIPEAEIADLIIELRSATAGVGTFTADFDKMAEVTGRLAEDVLAQTKQKAA